MNLKVHTEILLSSCLKSSKRTKIRDSMTFIELKKSLEILHTPIFFFTENLDLESLVLWALWFQRYKLTILTKLKVTSRGIIPWKDTEMRVLMS